MRVRLDKLEPMKPLYISLAIIGGVIPFLFFIPYFRAEGFGPITFTTALFTNGASGGITMDLLLSSLVFGVHTFTEKRVQKPYAFVIINILIGLSCALPLYLYFRQAEKKIL